MRELKIRKRGCACVRVCVYKSTTTKYVICNTCLGVDIHVLSYNYDICIALPTTRIHGVVGSSDKCSCERI